MEIIKKNFKELREMEKDSAEGLVIMGCAKPYDEWVKQVTAYLSRKDCIDNHETNPNKVWRAIYSTETTGGRIDLIFRFKEENNPLIIAELAIKRLIMPDTSWLSDYVVNYSDQHGYSEDEVL